MLPDVALLEIFDFYQYETRKRAWHTLVQVCRKWRNIVFGSPLRLDLRLYCTASTPVRETLDVWPLLPIVVRSDDYVSHRSQGVDNVIPALEHGNRISIWDLLFCVSSSQIEKVVAALQ